MSAAQTPTATAARPCPCPGPGALLLLACGAWLRLVACSNFDCASLTHTPKLWQSRGQLSRSVEPPTYYSGVVLNPAFNDKMNVDARLFENDEDLRKLPESFDARLAWPHCPSIGKIVNQGCCGSCWNSGLKVAGWGVPPDVPQAYSSAMAMTDRQCIHAHEHFEYSVEHLLHCSKTTANTSGCDGGDPADAFDYWTTRGVVSGGPFNSTLGCVPYTIPPSGPHCREPNSVSECPTDCVRPFPHSFHADRHFGDRYHLLPFNRSRNMQAEIMRGGPIVVILETYEDFKCYEKGVYTHVAGKLTSAHAVRLIGWGTQDAVPYWLAVNTWGTGWGERGVFKIRRGVDECRIESIRVVSGYPVTSRHAARP